VLAFRTIVFHKTADITITYSEKGAGSSWLWLIVVEKKILSI
jgi:hypothetical protein